MGGKGIVQGVQSNANKRTGSALALKRLQAQQQMRTFSAAAPVGLFGAAEARKHVRARPQTAGSSRSTPSAAASTVVSPQWRVRSPRDRPSSASRACGMQHSKSHAGGLTMLQRVRQAQAEAAGTDKDDAEATDSRAGWLSTTTATTTRMQVCVVA